MLNCPIKFIFLPLLRFHYCILYFCFLLDHWLQRVKVYFVNQRFEDVRRIIPKRDSWSYQFSSAVPNVPTALNCFRLRINHHVIHPDEIPEKEIVNPLRRASKKSVRRYVVFHQFHQCSNSNQRQQKRYETQTYYQDRIDKV